MTVNTAGGATVFIGTTAIPDPGNYDPTDAGEYSVALAQYEADSYIEVGEVESLGEFGDSSENIKFASLADGRMRSFKGPRDAGEMAVTVGDDGSDDGQVAMVAAEGTKFDYNFKVVLNDAATLGGTGSISYFYGKVMQKRQNVGNVSNVVRRNLTVALNSAIIEVAAT